MAFGDADRSQNQINYQGGLAQNHLNNTRDLLVGQNQNLWNNYLRGRETDSGNLSDIFSRYRGFLDKDLTNTDAYSGYKSLGSGGGNFSTDPALRGRTDEALSGYSDFAKTGGYSNQDIADLRARAIAPTRAVFANSQNAIDRQKALQGGYSPNFTAATAKMARDRATAIGDANVNVNASLADQIRQGKLAGLGGLAQTSFGQQGADQSLNSLNASQRLAGIGGMSDLQSKQFANLLSGMGGMANLYGTAPGLSGQAGNQALNSSGQVLNTNQLQNQLAQILIGGQNQKAGIPGDFTQAVGNIGSILGLIGQAGGAMSGLGGIPKAATSMFTNTDF